MRRIVVPLDGTTEAASVILDARRLLGPEGELVLLLDSRTVRGGTDTDRYGEAVGRAGEHVRAVAAALRDEGVTVRVPDFHDDVAGDIRRAISEWGVDMIACATHESDAGRRFSWGSTLRSVLAHSTVPILVCRPSGSRVASMPLCSRILVPLDGSKFAETALPLAKDLAKEWGAPIWLVQVVPMQAQSTADEVATSAEYLKAIAADVDGDVRTNIITGRSAATMLIRAAKERMVSDVVMASHGRTASPRFIMGSVAEALIQHLSCRIIVVPASAAESVNQTQNARREARVFSDACNSSLGV